MFRNPGGFLALEFEVDCSSKGWILIWALPRDAFLPGV